MADTGTIVVQITDNDISWESELDFEDVHFWLSVTLNMMMKHFLENNNEENSDAVGN